LNKFARHVHAHKVILLAIGFEQPHDFFCRGFRNLNGTKTPVRQDFAL